MTSYLAFTYKINEVVTKNGIKFTDSLVKNKFATFLVFFVCFRRSVVLCSYKFFDNPTIVKVHIMTRHP